MKINGALIARDKFTRTKIKGGIAIEYQSQDEFDYGSRVILEISGKDENDNAFVYVGSLWLPPKSRPKIGKTKVDH